MKLFFKQIRICILFFIGYVLWSMLFVFATGYKIGYLINLFIFWIAKKCCDKVKENAQIEMTEEEFEREEEKCELWLLIVGIVFLIVEVFALLSLPR